MYTMDARTRGKTMNATSMNTSTPAGPLASSDPSGADTEVSVATCPLCRKRGSPFLAEPDRLLGVNPGVRHQLFFCETCTHYFQSNIPTSELLEYYPPGYYRVAGSRPLAWLANLRVRNRARAIEWRARKGTVLDVGCGRGTLLLELQRRGWQVLGMDWNADNAAAVSMDLGVSVVGGPRALSSLPSASQDVVSLFHVLEHEDDPRALLAELHRLIKPGGRLLVAVPNANSAARSLFGRCWAGYDFPRHRQVFTPTSLRDALTRGGFQIDRLTGRWSDELLDIQHSARLWWRSRGRSSKLLIVATAAVGLATISVPRLFGRHAVMYAYARKA